MRAGKLRLPNEHTIFEFDTSDQEFENFILLCTQIDTGNRKEEPGLILSTPFLRVGGHLRQRTQGRPPSGRGTAGGAA